MSPLHPRLKKLFAIAAKAEGAAPLSSELTPPRDLVVRVLRECRRPSGLPGPALLELMVQRGAALAAALGVTTLVVQLSAGGSFAGIWNQALAQSAVLLRVLVP